jgi:hypothetical protein
MTEAQQQLKRGPIWLGSAAAIGRAVKRLGGRKGTNLAG